MITHPVLTRHIAAGIRMGLDRVTRLLRELGDPHLAVPVVHIGGTNGKGSVASLVASGLRAQGLKVGLTLSPHLRSVNERIRVDGVDISDDDLAALLVELDQVSTAWARAHLTDMGDGAPPLTYFELMIVAAFVWFVRQRVDVAVVEVGLGGRLDATNVVRPEVCAITTVDLDHCDRLGPDIPSVAAEKAGIFKAGVPVVIGRVSRDALRVLRPMAADRGCPMQVLGEDFTGEGTPRSFTWRGPGRALAGLSVGLDGAHQVDNAAVAVAVLEALGARKPDLRVGEAALRQGLQDVLHPGRCQWLASDLLVDGAHNTSGAERLAAYLRELPRDRRRTLVFGVSEDKEIRSIAAALAPEVDRILTTSCGHPRSMSPGKVAEALVGLDVPVMPAGPIEQALPLARGGEGLTVVAGSLYLVGAVLDLHPQAS
ncbi:MAG: bifunctional folylpolyglutamate synthase/dihydrofolate synthase [Alphaproteobacteria bacterium]|nr:bifunctional folylpolyglutamate synthase/dihydrofolate synthase [Alphaproteobacteria bacterium]